VFAFVGTTIVYTETLLLTGTCGKEEDIDDTITVQLAKSVYIKLKFSLISSTSKCSQSLSFLLVLITTMIIIIFLTVVIIVIPMIDNGQPLSFGRALYRANYRR
jgi:hypothetical protein